MVEGYAGDVGGEGGGVQVVRVGGWIGPGGREPASREGENCREEFRHFDWSFDLLLLGVSLGRSPWSFAFLSSLERGFSIGVIYWLGRSSFMLGYDTLLRSGTNNILA